MKKRGNVKSITIACMVFAILTCCGMTDARAVGEVDNALYARLLAAHVTDGVVDYAGLKGDEKTLAAYLSVLNRVDTARLGETELFAFHINAYNACTLAFVLTGYPGITSIKELGTLFRNPWKKRVCPVGGTLRTLDEIEHEILRPRFRDPRIHFAVNCASKGCPPLRSSPYTGENLDAELDEVTSAFINDPERNRLTGRDLYVSRIFSWYAEDFDDDIVGFFLRYARGDLKERLERLKDDVTIHYLSYDWLLNGK